MAGRRPTSDRLDDSSTRRRPGWRLQADGKIVVVGIAEMLSGVRTTKYWRSRATARTARSTRASPGDGKQTAASVAANGVAIQADGKIVAVAAPVAAPTTSRSPATTRRDASTRVLRRRQADDRLRGQRLRDAGWRSRPTARSSRSATASAAISRSPATTRTARSTPASPATASRRPTSAAADDVATEWRSRPTARSSSPGPPTAAARLRFRPLQPGWHARHELLRRRQAGDDFGGERRRRAAWRYRRTARSSRSGGRRSGATGSRLRPRPLHPERVARHEFLR